MNAPARPGKLTVGLVGPVPPPNGGMASQTAQLAGLLRAEGITVEQVATNPPYRPAAVGRLPVVRALFRLAPFILQLWRMAPRVDVIHLMANSGWSWQLYCAPTLWIGRFSGTPVVVNYRGGNARDYFRRAFRRVKPSLSLAAAVVVPSGFLEAVFREYGEVTTVIPNIVDRELFHPRDPAPSTDEGSYPFTLVITRNLEAIYGIDTALRALARARKRAGDLQLRIAGSGPEEPRLRALTRELGIADAVSFEGRLERSEIVALYRQADAVINPSTVDNMPNAVLEALACGLPVISSDVGGVPYIVEHGETALLFPPGNAAALASAILRLRNDRELRESLVRKGLAHVDQYSWPRVRRQWLGLYEGIARRREVSV